MLTKTSIKKPFTVIVMIIVIAIVGGVAVAKMPLDLFPDMDLPYIIVATMVPGTSPEEIEGKVTQPMEAQMRQINNVKEVQSISADNVSAVIMELNNGTDMTAITQDIDTKIKAIKSSFPKMSMEPIVMKIDPDMMPVMTLAISKAGQTIEQSSEELTNVAKKIQSVAGVASVSTTGQIENNVFMQINVNKLLDDPSNMLANHLSAYINNDRKVMPEKLVNVINSNDLFKEIFDVIKNNPHGLNAWLEEKKLSINGLLTGQIPEEQKKMLTDMLGSMLTPAMVSQMLVASNFEMPAGTTPVNGMDFFVKIGEKVTRYDELQHLPAMSLDLREMCLDPTLKKGTPQYEEKLMVNIIKKELNNYIKPTTTVEEIKATIDSITSGMDLPSVILNPIKTKLVNAIKDVFYLPTSGSTLTRDEETFNYLLGVFYQPVTIELTDFMYMYNTNTSSKEHTIIDGADGMMLSVYKTPDASVTSVTNGIIKLLDNMKENDPSLNSIVLANQGEVTKFMISSIAQNLLLGALFAIIVLLIFLRDWKPTVTVGMSIIVSLVTAFATMYLCGVTLNLVSMGGLALSVGMLVDNSIVVIENIYRKRNEGVSAIKAAYEGTKQVSGAILSSTITTVIVFLPIIFIEGMAKQIFKDLAITIAVSLFASLIVAITLVPMVSSRMLHIGKAARKESKIFVSMKKSYAKSLNFMLNKKWITIVVVLVLFVASIVSVFFMDVEFMPNTTMEQIVVTAGIRESKLTDDYSYDEIVDDVINDINDEFRKKKYIKNMGVEMSAGMTVMGFTMGGGNITAYVTLDKKAKIKPDKAQKELEDIVKNIATSSKYPKDAIAPGGISDAGGIDVQDMVNSYMDASRLAVHVYGTSVDEMQSAAVELKKRFEKIGDGVEVEDVLKNTTKEFKLIVDKNKASKFNYTTAQVFLQFFQDTVPATANSNINFSNDIGSSDIYIYTTENNMTRWYRAKDAEGNWHRMYFRLGDDTAKATHFIEKNKNGTETEFILDREAGKFKEKDGSREYSADVNDMPVYYDNSKIRDVDMVTHMMPVPNLEDLENMMNMDMGAMPFATEQGGDAKPKEKIPMFMLLDEKSFDIDVATKKVKYRNIGDKPAYASMIDDVNYYVDSNKDIRYNYTGDDVSTLKSLAPNKDINPRVPESIRMVRGFDTITHFEGRRVVQMGISSSTLSNKQLEREARNIIKDFNKNNEYNDINVEFIGQNKMIAETFNSLILMVVLAVIFIYLVMVAQFQSLKSPFIIMFTIPLALTGSILTLLMAGLPISVFALVGIILLVGIVVNNGIVYVDYVNKLMQSGMPKREALLRTAQDRIRPILMTALTTICSMLISVFDTSMGAAAIKPMAVTVVGGLTYATLLTLFFVPILYDLFNRKEKMNVIKFDDDKEDDIEAEMQLAKINDVKEVLEESKTLSMMDESFIANNMTTDDNKSGDESNEQSADENPIDDKSIDESSEEVVSEDASEENTEEVIKEEKTEEPIEEVNSTEENKTDIDNSTEEINNSIEENVNNAVDDDNSTDDSSKLSDEVTTDEESDKPNDTDEDDD